MKNVGAPRVAHRVGRYVASAVRRRGQLCTVVNPQSFTYRSGKVVQTNRATSFSATFSVLCDDPKHEVALLACTIKLTGKIHAGDAQKLTNIIRKPLPEGWSYGRLLLDSPGGNVMAAIEVSNVVRQALLYTAMGRPISARPSMPEGVEEYSCISACFLIWVAGAQRITVSFLMPRRPDGTSEIGLHRPYLDREAYNNSPSNVAAMQQEAMQLATNYLKREQVPQELIEKMLSRASTQVYWVGPEDPNISGMSPWFEEMMIARCGHNPDRVEEDARYKVDRIFKRLLATGVFEPDSPTLMNERVRQSQAREQQYFSCQQAAQRAAQAAIRAATK